MKRKSFIALFVMIYVVMLTAESVFAGIGDWMPTQEQMNYMGQMWYEQRQEQQRQKEIQQLQRQQYQIQQRLLEDELKTMQQRAEQREASKTTLMEAARKENVEALRKLLNAGENVNARDYDGDTALIYAVRENTNEVVRFLIDSGGYVNEATLEAAVKRKDFDILRTILKKEFDRDTLNRVVSNMYIYDTNSGVIRMLTEAGADINHKNSYWGTLLMKFVQYENANPDFVKDLINIGANVNAINDDGKTPLMYAARDGSSSVVKVLLEAGANVNTVDNSRKTALMYAAEKNTPDVVNVLLDAGAKIDMKDKDGRKAVDYAKPAYFGWDGGNPKLKDSSAFKRLGESDIWFKSI